MVEGTSDNSDCFITDYIEILGEGKEKNFEKQPEVSIAESDVFTKEPTKFDLNTESNEDESERDDSDDDIITTKSDHIPTNLESKPREDIINMINNNQCDIFEEMNKFNKTRINSLISEMNKLLGTLTIKILR